MHIYIYIYIKVSSVCSENPTHSCSCCAWNPHSCCSWSWVSPVCALALNISGQKASVVSSLASRASLSPPPTGLDWTVEERRRKERSYSSHSHLVRRLLSSPCCVALGEPCSHLLYFAVSRVAPFCCFLKLVTCSCHLHECPWLRVPAATLVLYAGAE